MAGSLRRLLDFRGTLHRNTGRDSDVNNSPNVSVVIPTYNYGRFLPEALASVLGQTHEDLEVIVVDDGSTDNTPDVLASVKDPRIKSVRTTNRGDSAARNTGLSMAHGKFIAFLDADDRWRPNKLELQLQVLNAEPEVGFVFGDFVRFDANGVFPETQFSFVPGFDKLETRPSAGGTGKVLKQDSFVALVPLDPSPVWLQASLFRAQCVAGICAPEGVRLAQDLYYLLLVYARGLSAAFIEEPLAEVRRHGSNSYGAASDMLMPIVNVLTMILKQNLSSQQARILRRRLADAWAAVGHHEFWMGKPLKTTLAYARALGYPGRRWNALAHILASPIAPLFPRPR
jgi:glycosyltransferase involved in cell wall biosynthesis